MKMSLNNFIACLGVGVNVGGQNDQPSASGLGTGSAMMSAEHDGRGGGHHSEVGASGQVSLSF
jgi:hypothetical protein